MSLEVQRRLCLGMVFLSALVAGFLASPSRGSLSTTDPAVLNSTEYFQLLESNASRIAVRFEVPPDGNVPEKARLILALPEPQAKLHIVDYACFAEGQEPDQIIERGSPEDPWNSTDFSDGCLKTDHFQWHDLPLLAVTLDTRLSLPGESSPRTHRLCRLEFSVEFPGRQNREVSDYAIAGPDAPPGGYAEILPRVVLNPESVAEFRRRPDLAFSDELFCPEALGRYSGSGQAARVQVESEGWYEIPYSQLTALGVRDWDPSRVNLWSQGEPVPLETQGLGPEGVWTEESRLRFWGLASPSPDTRARVYFLAEGRQPRRRLTPLAPAGEAAGEPLRSVTDELTQAPECFIEDDSHARLRGVWYWLKLTQDQPEITEEVPLLEMDPHAATVALTATLQSDIQEPCQLELLVDGQHSAGTLELGRWAKIHQQFEVPARWLLGPGHTLTWKVVGSLRHPETGGIFLKRLTWRYRRLLRIEEDDQLILQRSLWDQDKDLLLDATGAVAAFGRNASGDELWDLRSRVESTAEGPVLRLSGSPLPPGCTHLSILQAGACRSPQRLELVQPAFLHEATEPADVLFLSHRDFLDAIVPLVEWRRREGWKVRAVDVQAVYDEFSHGYYSAEAIRNFLTYTQIRWPAPIPQYVVLVGDSTYDPKNNLRTPNTSYLPCASYNRRVPIADPADEWFVRVNGSDGLSDLIIGRMSVNSVTDAQSVVQKVLRFEGQPLLGPWRSRTMLLSDNHFEARCERLLRATVPPLFEREHLQVRNYPMFTHQSFKDRGKNKKMTASANRELVAQLNEGTGLMEYFGHGGGCVIADEGWLVGADRASSDVLKLDNRRRLPFVAILSCLTGLINYPNTPFNYSLAEELVRRPEQGAIAVYGPSGFGGAHDHEVLTRGLNVNLYRRPMSRLGDATTLTEGLFFLLKDTSGINQQFNYFGDPLTRNSVPSTEGRLDCFPRAVDALQGGFLRLEGETPVFDAGRGVLRIYHAQSGQPLQSIPVRLNGGRLEAELCWPPGAPQGAIWVQGYLWNADLRRDVLVSTSFRSEVPRVALELASVGWDSTAEAVVISATLENQSLLPSSPVELALTAGPRQLERRTLALEAQARRLLHFRLVPEWVEPCSPVELTARLAPSASWAFETPNLPQVLRLALALDTPLDGLEKRVLAVDLSGTPEYVYLGRDSTPVPLQVTCSNWQGLSQLEARLIVSPDSVERWVLPAPVPLPRRWWRFELPVVLTESATEPLRLNLRRQWIHGPPRESTWALKHPIRSRSDLAVTHIEVADATPVAGYTVFLQGEFRNFGDPVNQPGHLKLTSDRRKPAVNPLSNQFNVEAPTLPDSLRRGEILRRLYRWEAFGNQGPIRFIGEVVGPGRQHARAAPSERFELPLHVLEYGNYIDQLDPLRSSEAGLIPEKIQQTYHRGLRELEWLIAYENFDENFAKLRRLQQLALFALDAGEFDLARRLVEKGISLDPEDPGNQYLLSSILFQQDRLEEGTEALRAALRGEFFEGPSVFAHDVRADPRLVRAKRGLRARHWQGAETLLYAILEHQPANLYALEFLGVLYRRNGLLQRAAETYQQILRLVDYDYAVLPEWWFRDAGQTYTELGQPEKALDIFAVGRKYHPQVDFALWESSPRVDLGQSQEVLNELLARDREKLGAEERVFAWYQIGRCYEALNRRPSAEEAFRSSLRVDPLHRASRRALLKLRTEKR